MSELELLHKLELRIAIEIKRVCEKNDIRYCLAYGSLLGAVRHGGFIPWDDDLDIAMPRSDYERFIQVFPNETNQDVFFLENWDTEKDFGLSFSKVKLNGTVFEENSISKTKTHKGIFVDVFPYDRLPDNKRKIRQIAKKLMILGKLYKFRLKYLPTNSNNKIQELLSKVIGVLSKAVPANRLKHRIYSLETKYNNRTDAIYTAVLSGAYNCKDLFPAAYLKNYINVLFEGELFPVPMEYKKVLTRIYGDYMELPPIEKRVLRHNAKRIDFGIYSDNIHNKDEGKKDDTHTTFCQ